MIVDNKHPDFGKMELLDAHGGKIKLLIKSFNTKTEEAEIYIPVDLVEEVDGQPMKVGVARTPKVPTEGNGWKCEVITAKVKIPGAQLSIKDEGNGDAPHNR